MPFIGAPFLTLIEIPDPGDGGEIPSETSGFVNLRPGGAAETRTLGNPKFVGQMLQITKHTNLGGVNFDVTITFARSVRTTTLTRAELTNAGSMLVLFSTEVDGDFYWRVHLTESVTFLV